MLIPPGYDGFSMPKMTGKVLNQSGSIVDGFDPQKIINHTLPQSYSAEQRFRTYGNQFGLGVVILRFTSFQPNGVLKHPTQT